MSDTIRILLVDDHTVLRAGLKALMEGEDDMVVVGEAGSGEQAIERAEMLKPDVIVMDLSMPGMGGLDATRILAQEHASKVLVLTMHSEDEYLLPVLEAGGSGFVRKTSADTDLIHAVRAVARGEVFLYPTAAKILLQGYKVKKETHADDPVEKLTTRERDVMAMTAEGFSSAEIGEKLFISPKTVDTYRSRIMEKLGFTHRSELVRHALKAGLLKP